MQVEVNNNKQSNLSDSKVLDKDVDIDVGINIGNTVQLIKQSF